jgi:hypothetical protein
MDEMSSANSKPISSSDVRLIFINYADLFVSVLSLSNCLFISIQGKAWMTLGVWKNMY